MQGSDNTYLLKISSNLNFLLVACLFLLNSTGFSNIIISILVLSNIALNYKAIQTLFSVKLLLLFSFMVSVFYGGMVMLENTEYLRIGILLVTFFMYPIQFKMSKLHFILLISVMAFLILMQFGEAMGVPLVDAILYQFYPIEDNIWKSGAIDGLESLADNRYAGVYYNPNIMGQNMVLFYAILMHYITRHGLFKWKIVLSGIIMISIVLTGGRTALFTFLILAIFMLKKDLKTQFLIPLISLLIIGLLINLSSITAYIDNFRSFDVGSLYGENLSSGTAKLDIFLNWFENLSQKGMDGSLELFFGISAISEQFDFDLGYILQMFGVLGLMCILVFFINVFNSFPKKNRFIFLMFSISMGATLIINFRFSILCIIILSLYSNNYKIEQADE